MTSVVNAKGIPLPYTGASTHWFSATGAGPELRGTSGNDSFWGNTSVNVTMY
ncbi:MAG: 1,3-1,4-beta-glycanase, partial [Mesorhizobium sp.]